jgi:protein gp37
MGEATGISWCDATFNPWIGCEKVSPGCAHCYAETLVTGRMGRPGTWGADGVRQRTSAANWKKPFRWNELAREGLLPDGKKNPDGHRPRVFCASLADVFEERKEIEPWRVELLDVIRATSELDWLVLTKRPEEARERLFEALSESLLPNLWLGVSIENSRHTWRADVLRTIPAAIKFISAEPLLGSLFAQPGVCGSCGHSTECHLGDGCDVEVSDWGSLDCGCRRRYAKSLDLAGIDWVIVGGESGGKAARPMYPTWVRELREAMLGRDPHEPLNPWPARPAFHFKQWGSWRPHPHGGAMVYAGANPKSGGKLLDGVEWCEFPEYDRQTLLI